MTRVFTITVAGLDIEFTLDTETEEVSASVLRVSDRNELINIDEEGILLKHSPRLAIDHIKDGKIIIKDADNYRVIGVLDPFDERNDEIGLLNAGTLLNFAAKDAELKELHHECNEERG